MRWFDRLVSELLHGLLRLTALVFSVVSAAAIYWLFSDLGDGLGAVLEAGSVTVAFALTGFLTTRAIALRVMLKQRLGMLMGIVLVYEFVEVTANVLRALVILPKLGWLGGLVVHWPFLWWLVVLVLSILPLTTLVLAVLDADLMRSRGAGSVAGPVRTGSVIPPKVNGLKQYWDSHRSPSP